MFLILLCLVAVASAQGAPNVNTTQGGVIGTQAADGNYLSFFGIHYGGSTSGDNRFKAPTDPPVYTNPYYANNSQIICAQPSQQGIIGIEDCLVLNIHTQNLTTPKPVFVWLEGEEYEKTSKNSLSYKILVEQGIVVVSVNYRLSIFGFLCLGVPEAPGNAGLKDVTHALKWIQANIAAFGGNPNNVTLAGHGSGAAMVDLITLSPLSHNLVHQALVLSGSALAPWAMSYDPIGYAQMVGQTLAYENKSPNELGKLFTTTNFELLSGVFSEFEFHNNTPLFAPCVENPKLDPSGAVIIDAPINILKSGNYPNIPYITGFTDREGTIRAEQAALGNWLQKMNDNFEEFLTADLVFNSAADKTNASKTIREFYFAEQAIRMETIQDYLDFQGDLLVLVPVTRGAQARALHSDSVRLFEFAYKGTQNTDWGFPQIPLSGARHGAIPKYLFNYDLRPEIDASPSNAIIKRIVTFTQTGSIEYNNSVYWQPISSTTLTNILYYSGGEVQPNVTIFQEVGQVNRNAERIDFWNKIFDFYYQPPRSVSGANNVLSLGVVVLLAQIFIRCL